MRERPEKYGALWSREELILAFELYCRIPFKATKASNPEIKHLAALLRRSPASLARKLGNLGAFDPLLKERNISGLTHTGRLDREIWEEFNRDWPKLVSVAHRLRSSLEKVGKTTDKVLHEPTGPSERTITKRQRLHQSFFRQAVLSSYENSCCVTGIQLAEVLIASHIVPWSVDQNLRVDPTNGVCLSATFDRLFDSGLMSFDDDHCIRLSQRIIRDRNEKIALLVSIYHGKPMHLPTRFPPRAESLRWHRDNVFVG